MCWWWCGHPSTYVFMDIALRKIINRTWIDRFLGYRACAGRGFGDPAGVDIEGFTGRGGSTIPLQAEVEGARVLGTRAGTVDPTGDGGMNRAGVAALAIHRGVGEARAGDEPVEAGIDHEGDVGLDIRAGNGDQTPVLVPMGKAAVRDMAGFAEAGAVFQAEFDGERIACGAGHAGTHVPAGFRGVIAGQVGPVGSGADQRGVCRGVIDDEHRTKGIVTGRGDGDQIGACRAGAVRNSDVPILAGLAHEAGGDAGG